jgi:hypothetical protein
MNRIWRCASGIRPIQKNDSIILLDMVVPYRAVCTLNERRIVGAKRNYPTDNSR